MSYTPEEIMFDGGEKKTPAAMSIKIPSDVYRGSFWIKVRKRQ